MRVSTARQEEEQTIGNQKMELLEKVSAEGDMLSPDCIYMDEGWTGMILERPGLDKMRTDARDRKFEILYFYDRGRISRKYTYQEIVLDELRQLGIKAISLHDINGEDDEAQLMGGFMGLFAEYERVKIRERMRLGKMRKVKENKKLLGYNPKYGYDYHPRIKTGDQTRDGHFTINEQQAKIVGLIFERVAGGMSKNGVRRELLDRGIMPPKGMREQWSGGTLDRLLRDTTYIGQHFYNKSEAVATRNPRNPEQKYRRVAKGSRKPRPKEEWLQVDVPAIISEELFNKVQARLIANKRLNPRNNWRNQYLVGGLIYCTCGQARTGDPGAKGNLYYRCNDRLNKFPMPRTCHEAGINVPVLDMTVWQNVKLLLTEPGLVRQQAERWQKDTSPLEAQLTELETRLKGLDDEERRYVKVYGQGHMSERIYKENVAELNEKRSKLLVEIAGIRDTLASKRPLPLEKMVDGVIELVGNLDFTDKKAVIRKLVTKIVATKKEINIWGQIPILATGQVGYESSYRHRWPA